MSPSQVQRLWETLTDPGGYLHRLKTGKLDERLRKMIEKLIREDLDQARECLQLIADAGAAVPRLSAEMVKCAAEQGIELPGKRTLRREGLDIQALRLPWQGRQAARRSMPATAPP